MTEYQVSEYDDLQGAKLSSAGKDRVLAALDEEEAIVYVEQWVFDEKDLDPLEGALSLIGIDGIDAETEKAWLVIQGDTKEWLPKSVCELYRKDGDEVDSESSPQVFLKEWQS